MTLDCIRIEKSILMRSETLTTPNTARGLWADQSCDVWNVFWPIPGLISCAGVTGSVGITRVHLMHVHIITISGFV